MLMLNLINSKYVGYRRHGMKTIESYKVNMPEYSMSYIHNADASGIEEAWHE